MQALQPKQIFGVIIHCVTVFHQREDIEFLKPFAELLKRLSSMKVNFYCISILVIQYIAIYAYYTVYLQIFEGCNFQYFCGQLAICEIFILEILLAKLWLTSIGEQDTCE